MLTFYLSSIKTPDQKEKFEYIYKHYFGFMLKTALLITKNESFAEDAVHETFLQIMNEIETIKIENERSLKSYIYILTRERTIDFLRKWDRTKGKVQSLEVLFCDESETEPEYLVLTKIKLDQALHILSSMPSPYRQCLILSVKGYSISEISQITNSSESAVKSRIHRARQKLLSAFTDSPLE